MCLWATHFLYFWSETHKFWSHHGSSSLTQASIWLDRSGAILNMLLYININHRIRHYLYALWCIAVLFWDFEMFKPQTHTTKLVHCQWIIGRNSYGKRGDPTVKESLKTHAFDSTARLLRCTRLHLFKNFSFPILTMFHSACFNIKLDRSKKLVLERTSFVKLTISIRIVDFWKGIDVFRWQ